MAAAAAIARIHKLLSQNKFKKPPLPPPDVIPPMAHREFHRVFRYFDEDGDGKISPAELRNCLRATGDDISPQAAVEVVESSDSDCDGMLCYEDFVRLVNAGGEEERVRTLRLAFAVYEKKGRGCITAGSLRRALKLLGEDKGVENCRDMIRRFDLNGDGVICFEEFKLMML